ncbi:MAG: helix-turn-helix domain-containing protein, partial [Spirochaetia bacterium]|nr:helix-turn-helix domain-containing protein [Spirochaetia bacterium]
SGFHKTLHRKTRIRKGDCYFFNVGESHAYEVDDPLDLINILIQKSFFKNLPAGFRSPDLFENLLIGDFVAGKAGGFREIHLGTRDFLGLRNMLEEWILEDERRAFNYQAVLEAKSLELFAVLARIHHGLASEPETNSDEEKLSQVLEFISANMARPLELRELAGLLPASAGHFSRWFKTQTGYAPFEYLGEVRVERACQLLKSTKDSAKRIAEACGYPSASLFFRQFRKQMGVTPLQFRKQATS